MMGEIPNNISHVSSQYAELSDESSGEWLEWLMKNDDMEEPQWRSRIVKTEDV